MSYLGPMTLIVNSLGAKGAIFELSFIQLLLLGLDLSRVDLWHEEDIDLSHLLATKELCPFLEGKLCSLVTYLRLILDTFCRIVGIK